MAHDTIEVLFDSSIYRRTIFAVFKIFRYFLSVNEQTNATQNEMSDDDTKSQFFYLVLTTLSLVP